MRLSDAIPATKHHLKMFLDEAQNDRPNVRQDSGGRMKRPSAAETAALEAQYFEKFALAVRKAADRKRAGLPSLLWVAALRPHKRS